MYYNSNNIINKIIFLFNLNHNKFYFIINYYFVSIFILYYKLVIAKINEQFYFKKIIINLLCVKDLLF